MLVAIGVALLWQLQGHAPVRKPSATYIAVIQREALIRDAVLRLSSTVEAIGFQRVPDRTMEFAGIMLLRSGKPDAMKRSAELVAKLDNLRLVPVFEGPSGLEIVSPRYLVHPQPNTSIEALGRHLREGGFTILSGPSKYRSFFLVTRSLDADCIPAEMKKLVAVPGVLRVSPETFLKPM